MDAVLQFEKLTGQARRAVWLAYQEAQRFDHDYLASEHLLAGLLREGSTEIAAVFREQDIKPEEVIEKLEMTLAQAQPGIGSSG
jgi:ATP-dependent Clp protease ATP-binding subunit ClpC